MPPRFYITTRHIATLIPAPDGENLEATLYEIVASHATGSEVSVCTMLVPRAGIATLYAALALFELRGEVTVLHGDEAIAFRAMAVPSDEAPASRLPHFAETIAALERCVAK